MTTAYSTNLGLALPVQGELSGAWGDTVNNGITQYSDIAIAGTLTLNGDGAVTLSNTNGDASATNIGSTTAQYAILKITGTTTAKVITAPSSSKTYTVINASSNDVTVKASGQTGVTIPAGDKAFIAFNGTDYVRVGASAGGSNTQVQYNSGGNLAGSSNFTFNGTTATINTLNLTNALGVAYGGTGATSLAANNVILGNGTSAVQFVAPGASGNVLTSNGTTWASTALPAGGLTYVYKTANYTTKDKEGVLADTTGGAFTVTLPAGPATGAQVVVADAGGVWGTNNLTVGRNGSTISNLAENLVCDISGASVQLVYDGTTWEVYAQVGGNGGTAVTLTGTQTLTNKTISGASNTLTVDGTNAVGFRTVPQNSQSAAYTAVLDDSGKQIFHPSADTTARTFTIPANSSVAYPIGTALTFINQNGAGVVTIAITSDTMRLAGAGTTGSRTLAANGIATAVKVTSTEWIISGTGLT